MGGSRTRSTDSVNDSFDVVILGGGPCGLAAAIALAVRGHRVGLFERNAFGGPRVGETFGPEIVSPLRELGVLDDFMTLDNVPFRGVKSAWGARELVDRPSIVHPLGEGFHVDRARFDEMLLQRARSVGVVLHEHTGTARIESTDTGICLSWSNNHDAVAAYVIDASGRGAPAGARGFSDRRWVACDRGVGIVARLSPKEKRDYEPELLIETVETGWWYVALQPGPTLLCVWMTDADLLGPNHRVELRSRWLAALEATVHVRALCAEAELMDGPRVVRADTGFLRPNRGRRWRAVGDAAFASDPLSGDGVVRGLSDALSAARDADSFLSGAIAPFEAAPLDIDKRIPTYLDTRHRYYRIEKRWSESLFWKRRHAIDWQDTRVGLDPRVLLRAVETSVDMHVLAPIEGLIPPRVVLSALVFCAKPRAAHEVLGHIRNLAPLGDRRLLVGLQALVSSGLLVVDG